MSGLSLNKNVLPEVQAETELDLQYVYGTFFSYPYQEQIVGKVRTWYENVFLDCFGGMKRTNRLCRDASCRLHGEHHETLKVCLRATARSAVLCCTSMRTRCSSSLYLRRMSDTERSNVVVVELHENILEKPLGTRAVQHS